MATGTITNTTTDINGNVVGNVTVVINLQPPGGFRISDNSEVAPQYSTISSSGGSWSIALEQTSNISPAGSFYVVQEQYSAAQGGYREYAFTVAAGTNSLFSSLLATNPPTPTTNYLTQIQGDARYALKSSTSTVTGLIDVTAFGAKGDGVTDDTAAIQAAIAAAEGSTGRGILFPPLGGVATTYLCAGTLDASLSRSIEFFTWGGSEGTTANPVVLSYSGTGSRFIDARSSIGFRIRGIRLNATNAGFTGKLVDLSRLSGNDTTAYTLTNTYLGNSGGNADLTFLDGSSDGHFIDVHWIGGQHQVVGTSATFGYANGVQFDSCEWSAAVVSGIHNPGDSWLFNCPVVEPLSSGGAGWITHDAGRSSNAMTIIDPEIGDDSNSVSGTWINLAGTALSIFGGVMNIHQLTTGIAFDTGFDGFTMYGTELNGNVNDLTQLAIGIDFTNVTNTISNVDIRGIRAKGFQQQRLYFNSPPTLNAWQAVNDTAASVMPPFFRMGSSMAFARTVNGPSLQGDLITAGPTPNVMTVDQSNLNGSTGAVPFAAGTGITSLARSTAQPFGTNTYSLLVTCSTASANPSFVSNPANAVASQKLYTGLVQLFPNTTTMRRFSVNLGFKDGGGSLIGNEFQGGLFTESSGNWTQAWVSAISPSSSATAYLRTTIYGPANGEQHYNSQNSIGQGFDTGWQLPGTVPSSPPLITTGGIGVGNAIVGTTVGTVTHKMPLYDTGGSLLGYVPIVSTTS